MKNEYIKNFPYLDQRDNEKTPLTSCYNTSMGMAITHCLNLEGLDKKIIGCPYDVQIEDFINEMTMSDDIKKWIKDNISRYGNWMLKYKPRTIAVVEEYIFNLLMAPIGYKSEFKTDLTYEQYCNHIKNEKMPIVLHGYFKSVSKVGGHIVCGIGYDDEKQTIICNDPFGNAIIDKYQSGYLGRKAEYPLKFFLKKKKDFWGQVISKI